MLWAFRKGNAGLILVSVALILFMTGNTQRAFNYSMSGIQVFSQKFPVIYDAVLTAIGLYILWRALKIVFWFWCRLVINTIKITLVVTAVMIGFAVYLRGMEVFFSKDIPLVFGYCWSNRAVLANQFASVVTTSFRSVLSAVNTVRVHRRAFKQPESVSYAQYALNQFEVAMNSIANSLKDGINEQQIALENHLKDWIMSYIPNSSK